MGISSPEHGSPQDRGSADKYYGRQYKPHYYRHLKSKSIRITLDFMTDKQIQEYSEGYDTEEDKKDWGWG